jgi:hypothetical protein
MGKRDVARREKKEAAVASAPVHDRLRELGIEPGAAVRFRKTGGGNYIEATVLPDVGKDGSLTLFAKGKTRAIMPEAVEVADRGPRGGKVWRPLVEA